MGAVLHVGKGFLYSGGLRGTGGNGQLSILRLLTPGTCTLMGYLSRLQRVGFFYNYKTIMTFQI
jgi:hypothetical protein